MNKLIIGYKKTNKIYDLHEKIDHDISDDLVPIFYHDGLEIIRHTMAHILGQALLIQYKNVDFAQGPVTENGFYYDFNINRSISSQELKDIELIMHNIINQKLPIIKNSYNKQEILNLYKNSKLKIEILNKLPNDLNFSTYSQGENDNKFIDLCKGPHLLNTELATKYFKLISVSEVTWRDYKLQRISGVAFSNLEDYNNYINQKERANECKAIKIASDMNLYFVNENAPGCLFWTEQGNLYLNLLKEKIREYLKDYKEIQTPIIYKDNLWKKTGHLDKYTSNMFICNHDENNTYILKPMNCPGHALYFEHLKAHESELPIRITEFGLVSRKEPAGALVGGKRLQNFCIDDGHIFCTIDQIITETKKFIKEAILLYNDLELENIEFAISTRPEHSIGTDKEWSIAEQSLINAMNDLNIKYNINNGDGAFYGPKIEFGLRDKFNHLWQCGTFQIDFFLAKRLNISYTINNTHLVEYPIILHRAILGSIERFSSLLLEIKEGKIPLFLHPIQIIILPISEKFKKEGELLMEKIKTQNIRVQLDSSSNTLSKRLKINIQKKIPFIIILGQKEIENNILSIRHYNIELSLSYDDLIKKFNK